MCLHEIWFKRNSIIGKIGPMPAVSNASSIWGFFCKGRINIAFWHFPSWLTFTRNLSTTIGFINIIIALVGTLFSASSCKYQMPFYSKDKKFSFLYTFTTQEAHMRTWTQPTVDQVDVKRLCSSKPRQREFAMFAMTVYTAHKCFRTGEKEEMPSSLYTKSSSIWGH